MTIMQALSGDECWAIPPGLSLSSIDAKLDKIDKQIQRNREWIQRTQAMLLERSIIKSYVSPADLAETRAKAETHAEACFNDADRCRRIKQSIQAVSLSDCTAGMKAAMYRTICLL